MLHASSDCDALSVSRWVGVDQTMLFGNPWGEGAASRSVSNWVEVAILNHQQQSWGGGAARGLSVS